MEFGTGCTCHIGDGVTLSTLPKLEPRWVPGFWLGKCQKTDGHVCLTKSGPDGALEFRSYRSVLSLSPAAQWDNVRDLLEPLPLP